MSKPVSKEPARCEGRMQNGPGKRYSRCGRCKRTDYEANEGDRCRGPVEPSLDPAKPAEVRGHSVSVLRDRRWDWLLNARDGLRAALHWADKVADLGAHERDRELAGTIRRLYVELERDLGLDELRQQGGPR